MTFATLDVETTIKQSYKRKANAFDPENWVVWVGDAIGNGPVRTTRYKTQEESRNWFGRWLKDNPTVKVIVGFNIKFDILHAIAKLEDVESYEAYMDFISNGGQLWDVQLVEYLLRGMEQSSHMLSLDEVAPKYGGHVKPDPVKELWAAGVDTPDIPDDLMLEYLPGDIENTRKAFLGQVVAAKKVDQQKSIMLNNGALVYTIEAEKNGMKVDYELGLKLAAELEEQLDGLLQELEGHLPADLPFKFNWGSRTQLSALIFGGDVKYTIKAPILEEDEGGELAPVYYQLKQTHYLCADGSTIECEKYNDAIIAGQAAPVLSYFLSGKNSGSPKTKSVTVPDIERGPKMRNEDRVYSFSGVTEPRSQWKTATDGVYQTSAAVISALGNQGIPFLEALAARAKVDKDLGTYFIRNDKQGNPTGMLTLVQLDGLIHHMINMTSTVTARFSSSNPNMQNIPKGDKSKIKQVFISRFGDGYIIQSDFTSLEIYIQAIITNCRQMIQDLIEGLDMHVSRVASTMGISYEEAFQKCKVDELPEWVKKRSKAKNFSFQRAYGAGAQAISDSTGIPLEEVKLLIEAEALRYPEVETFYADLIVKITNSKQGVRKVLPHPDFPAKQVPLGVGYYRTPDGKLYSYQEQCAPKFVVEREGKFSSFSPTEAKNYIVQGSGAEWAKAACWLMVREFYRRRNFGGLALLINQVHDAAYADSHAKVAQEAAAVIHACMELASPFMEVYFKWPCPVHVPSETTYGRSMAEELKVPDVKANAEAIKPELYNRYISQYE
ncbi:DNA polymerase [Pseudomonas phage Eisa9]|uniref:DNA polymerase n=1 Tax=Pseudomonas phage Eisa9 TaxID=2900148 RepID=A0AAE8YKG3_9CAUD|nr:DNA polymerase [Pseudomonas phage Eisa9]